MCPGKMPTEWARCKKYYFLASDEQEMLSLLHEYKIHSNISEWYNLYMIQESMMTHLLYICFFWHLSLLHEPGQLDLPLDFRHFKHG